MEAEVPRCRNRLLASVLHVEQQPLGMDDARERRGVGAHTPASVRAKRDGRSESQPRARRHHRRTAGADGGDDRLGVDGLEVDRRRAEVGVPELTLDVERDTLAGELNRVGVAQLVRREPTPDARARRAGGARSGPRHPTTVARGWAHR
jgi:hypothetical protein